MDTSDLQVTVDSPRLLRSMTKKLQQQASGLFHIEYSTFKIFLFLLAKKILAYEDETIASDPLVIRLCFFKV
jgi:hypothetical protein